MKLIVLILALFFVTASAPSAQNSKFVVVRDLNMSKGSSAENFKAAVNEINSVPGIDFIILLGNLTAKGATVEFESLFRSSEELTKPLYILPGESELRYGIEGIFSFSESYGNGNFIFEHNRTWHIGVTTAFPKLAGNGFIRVETFAWLKNELSNIPSTSDIIFYVNNPSNGKTLNLDELINLFTGYRISAVYSQDEEDIRLLESANLNVFNTRIFSAARSTGYSIVEEKKDTLFIYDRESGKNPVLSSTLIKSGQIFTAKEIEPTSLETHKNLIAQTHLSASLVSSITSGRDNIYSASLSGIITCIEKNGKVKWSYDTRSTIITKPAVDGDVLTIGTLQGDLFTFNANNGDVLQVIGIGTALTSDPVIVDVNTFEGTRKGIVVGDEFGNLYCYDMFSLHLLWESAVSQFLIQSKPLYIRDRIIFASWDGNLYSVDASSGTLNWKWSGGINLQGLPAICSPVTDGRYVFFVTADFHLVAVDLLLGTTVWRKSDIKITESISISNDYKILFVKGSSDKIYVLSPANGRVTGEVNGNYGTDYFYSLPVQYDDGLIFSAQSGSIYKAGKDLKPLKIFDANAPVHSIQMLRDGIIAAADVSGTVYIFKNEK